MPSFYVPVLETLHAEDRHLESYRNCLSASIAYRNEGLSSKPCFPVLANAGTSLKHKENVANASLIVCSNPR